MITWGFQLGPELTCCIFVRSFVTADAVLVVIGMALVILQLQVKDKASDGRKGD